MKWLVAWLTFSCVVVPVYASACGRLREARRGQGMPTMASPRPQPAPFALPEPVRPNFPGRTTRFRYGQYVFQGTSKSSRRYPHLISILNVRFPAGS
jgi:hypothetical protein